MNNKITIRGKAKILEGDEKYIIKEKNKSLKELFNYLDLRSYNNHPSIIEEKENYIKYKYFDNYEINALETDEEFIKTISSLHEKTTYFKDVSRKKYKDIYTTLMDNIDYLKEFYSKTIFNIDNERYMSPSSYLLARNFSIINSNLIYLEKELNSWYNLVKDKTKERVCIVHNNLRKDNFLRGESNILIGWDRYAVDTPVLDLYKLYKNEYKNIDFISLLKIYNDNYKLSNEEIKLFNILISMPKKVNLDINEVDKVKSVKYLLDYIYRSNNLVKSGVFD